MRLGRTAVLNLLAQVAASVAGFLATFYIAREFGAGLLGQYSVVVALVFWFSVPVEAVGSALTKRMSERDAPGRYLAGGIALVLAIGAAVAVAVVLGAPLVNSYLEAEIAVPVAALVVSYFLFTAATSALDGANRVGRSGLVEAGERVLRTALQIGLLVFGFGLLGLVAGHAVAMLLAALCALALVGREVRPALPGRRELERLGSFARYAWLGTIQTVAFAWMDTLVLGVFSTNARIGIYEASWTLGSTLMLAAFSIRRTLFPELSALGERGDYERVRHFLDEGLVYLGLLAIPGLFGALVVGDRVLRIYRPAFSRGALVLAVLVLAQLLAGYAKHFTNAISAIDRPEVAYRVNAGFIGANLLLNLALVPLFDWYGAAVATALSATVALGYGYVALRRLVGFREVPYGELGRQVLSAGAMAAVVLGLRQVAPVGNGVTVVLVGIGAAVYGACLLALSRRVRTKALGLVRSVG